MDEYLSIIIIIIIQYPQPYKSDITTPTATVPIENLRYSLPTLIQYPTTNLSKKKIPNYQYINVSLLK